MSRSSVDPRWVQGTVRVPASPDVVWTRLTDVASWPQMLSDIARMKVVDHTGSQWSIELETRTLDHGMLPYRVQIDRGRVVKLSAQQPGITVEALTAVREGSTPAECEVAYSLFIQTSGLVSLLLSEKALRQKQDHIVAVTLADIYRAYEPR